METRTLHDCIILQVFLATRSKEFHFVTPCKSLDRPSARLDKGILRQVFAVSTGLPWQGDIQEGKAIRLRQGSANSCHPQFRHCPQWITGAGRLAAHTPSLPVTWGSYVGSLPNTFRSKVIPLKFLPCLLHISSATLGTAACGNTFGSNCTAKSMFVACISFHKAVLNPPPALWAGLEPREQQRAGASPLRQPLCGTTVAG